MQLILARFCPHSAAVESCHDYLCNVFEFEEISRLDYLESDFSSDFSSVLDSSFFAEALAFGAAFFAEALAFGAAFFGAAFAF